MVITEESFQLVRMKKWAVKGYYSSKYLSKLSKQTTMVATMLAGQAMQGKLIDLSEILNNDLSC